MLTTIEPQAKTKEELTVAKIAERNIIFSEKLKNAQVFLKIEKWEATAENFHEAAKYLDSTQGDQTEIKGLKASQIYFKQQAFKDADIKYDEFFSRYY